jgi:hypothetical protein
MPNGSSAADRASLQGWYERDDHPDERNAAELARQFTSGLLEAELLLKFCRSRSSALMGTERAQALVADLAQALLKRSPLPGSDAVAVLGRADRIYEVEKMSEGRR